MCNVHFKLASICAHLKGFLCWIKQKTKYCALLKVTRQSYSLFIIVQEAGLQWLQQNVEANRHLANINRAVRVCECDWRDFPTEVERQVEQVQTPPELCSNNGRSKKEADYAFLLGQNWDLIIGRWACLFCYALFVCHALPKCTTTFIATPDK